MNTQHTPGPWRLGKPFNGYVWGPDPSRGDASRANWPLVEIQAYRQRPVYSDEDEANARLIAAAPELLDALQGLLDQIQNGKPFTGSREDMERKSVTTARAAIAKATQP